MVAVYDASGQYLPNILFGNDFWMGSSNACRDLQLKQYYHSTPPFDATFFVAKINISLDGDHLPQVNFFLLFSDIGTSARFTSTYISYKTATLLFINIISALFCLLGIGLSSLTPTFSIL